MIIFGKGSTLRISEPVFLKCSHCGQSNTINIQVYRKYAHFFWIPMFPIGKTGVSVCSHCKQTLKVSEMPADYKAEYDRVKTNAGVPVWNFAGLFLIAGLFVIGFFAAQENEKYTKQYISEPRPSDIMEIRNEFRSYTLYKVHSVKGDTIFYLESNYEVSKSRKLDEILEKQDAFSDEPRYFTKNEMLELFSKGKIQKISREGD